MKLSTLLDYYIQLKEQAPEAYNFGIDRQVGPSLSLVQNHDLQFAELTDNLIGKYNQIHHAVSDYSVVLDEIRDKIKRLISDIEPQYFADSYRYYSEEFVNDPSDYILTRKLVLSDESRMHVSARVKRHGDWKHAGLIIRPGVDVWTDDLVGCDPLYLIDRDMDLLRPTVERFPIQYRGRLRTYLLNDSNDGPILKAIPNGQFAFCLVYYFFNFMPFEMIKTYLTEIYEKLKPGGTLAFTFNDCDLPGGVIMMENHFMCYTPGKLLMSLAENIGYEVFHTHHLDKACAWTELRKPGTLTSLRGGQALAKIMPKPVAKSK